MNVDSKSGSTLIKLREELPKVVNHAMRVCQNACPDKLHPPRNSFRLSLPRKFREQRALAIASWYLPDWLKWEVLLQLREEHNFDHISFNWVQEIELYCLSEKEEIALHYIVESYNLRQLFGTILQEDLQKALMSLEIIKEKQGPVRRPIRRKGYRDKGTWRPPHRWKPTSDYSLTQKQNREELIQTCLRTITQLYLSKLGEN